MSLPVFFSPEIEFPVAPGTQLTLTGDEGFHAVTVARISVGKSLIIADGTGQGVVATATAIEGKNTLRAVADEVLAAPAGQPHIIIAQALPKAERSELAIDLTTQAGASEVIPWAAKRCIAVWKGAKKTKGITKWQQAATAAAKQSRRLDIPRIRDLSTTSDIVTDISDIVAGGGAAIVLDENGHDRLTAHRAALAAAVAADKPILVVVGPEGGITPEELQAFVAAGAQAVSLGPEILRTATAGFAAISVISAVTGWW